MKLPTISRRRTPRSSSLDRLRNHTQETYCWAKNTYKATVKSFQEVESETDKTHFGSRFNSFSHMIKSARKDIAALITARDLLQKEVDFGTSNGRNDLDQINAELHLRESQLLSEILSCEMSPSEPSIIGMEEKAAVMARQFLATPQSP
jgi:hypothetical protein